MSIRSTIPRATAIAMLIAAIVSVAPAATPSMQYQPAQHSYVTTAGGTLSINVYLTETSSPTTDLLGTEQGLSDSAVQIVRNGGDATFTLATPNSAFGDSSSSGTFSNGATPSAAFQLHISVAGHPTQGVLPVNHQVLLGVVQLQAGTTTSTFTVSNSDPINHSLTFSNTYDLDTVDPSLPADYQPARADSFTVSVPEPASMMTIVPGLGWLITARRLRMPVAGEKRGCRGVPYNGNSFESTTVEEPC